MSSNLVSVRIDVNEEGEAKVSISPTKRRKLIIVKIGRIYVVKNDVNDIVYIGSTWKELVERMSVHCRVSRQSRNSKWYEAMREIGEDNFYIELLEEVQIDVKHPEDLEKREFEWIAKYPEEQLYNTEKVYRRKSAETRKKMSAHRRGKVNHNFKRGHIWVDIKKQRFVFCYSINGQRRKEAFSFNPQAKTVNYDREEAYFQLQQFRNAIFPLPAERGSSD